MAPRTQTENSRPGDLLVVVHEFQARSPDELALTRGDRIQLIERDDDFGDGWFLGRNTETGESGLFPEVYTRLAPKPTINAALHQRNPSQTASPSQQHDPQPVATAPPSSSTPPPSAPLPLAAASASSSAPVPAAQESTPSMEPLPLASPAAVAQAGPTNRASVSLPTRSISQTLSGEVPGEDETMNSPVMHETLSVIDEHITDMSTPRHSVNGKDARGNDSGSEYSSHHRISYINGQETEEEEQGMHTEEEVSTWSPARVAEYLEDVGVEKKHCDIFKEQEINGEVLLGIDQATIFLKEFELGPVGPRLRTWLKIKALQQEVKTMKEAQKNMALLEAQEQPPVDPARNRATSMSAVLPRIPSLGQGQMKSGSLRQAPRANSTAGHSPLPAVEATPPLAQYSPVSPTRPSAASIRSLNHNRRHSSIDSAINQPPPPTSAGAMRPPPAAKQHKKTPSFDRGWTMGSPQQQQPDSLKRPSSSHHAHSTSADISARNAEITPIVTDLDRGYFSGGEVENRKARNVLRKKDSPNHSRTPSFSSEASRRAAQSSRRHNRMTSVESATGSISPMSPAAKAYYGTSVRSGRSSSNAEFARPLKSLNESSPTVTKLDYSSSIDAVAKSPRLPNSESSSTGRASPSPAAQTHSHSFFGKKSRSGGLRAISDAITKQTQPTADAKDSPLQSPTRTGSTTPSGASVSKSFDSDSLDISKRLPSTTASSTKDSAKRRSSKKHSTSAYTRGREPISPQEAMKNCDYSGWMKKKSSSLMTTWKTRLFVLRGRRLSYYYTEYDTEEKGLIDISSHRVLPANNERITGFHAALTRAASSPSSPQNATIPTTASADSANVLGEDMAGMFIFKLVPPRAGLQRGVQFTKPIVHYFAVDSIQVGRLWMAALMKATIDRDDTLAVTTTYQQRTITLEKARQMRQRPPALMDDDDNTEKLSVGESKQSAHSKESVHESVIHEEDSEQGLAISGLDEAKALLDFAENGEPPQSAGGGDESRPPSKRKESIGMIPGVVT